MPIPALVRPQNMCPPTGDTLWIWGVGDSITAGPTPLGGWRSILLEHVRGKRPTANMTGDLGNVTYGYDVPACGTYFAGHGGSSAAQWAPSGGNWINTLDPTFLAVGPVHLALIALGANSPNNVPAGQQVGECIGAVLTNHPRAVVFVSNCTPQYDIGTGNEIPRDVINAEIEAQANAYYAAGSNVVFVDMYAALTKQMLTTDGLHPDYPGNGYPMMASQWWAAMQPWINP